MKEIVITPKKEGDTDFLLKLLKSLSSVSSVKIRSRDENEVNNEFRLSESSLANDWLSEEDDRWDELLKR